MLGKGSDGWLKGAFLSPLYRFASDLVRYVEGGDDSWYARPQLKYQLKGQESHGYSFFLIPFDRSSKEQLVQMSKHYAHLEQTGS